MSVIQRDYHNIKAGRAYSVNTSNNYVYNENKKKQIQGFNSYGSHASKNTWSIWWYMHHKAVGTVLGLGGAKKILRGFEAQIFFISHLHIKGIQFSSLVYLWFQNSLSYQSILSLFIYTYLYLTIFKLLIFLVGKILGGGNCPPPLFLRPCIRCYSHRYGWVKLNVKLWIIGSFYSWWYIVLYPLPLDWSMFRWWSITGSPLHALSVCDTESSFHVIGKNGLVGMTKHAFQRSFNKEHGYKEIYVVLLCQCLLPID